MVIGHLQVQVHQVCEAIQQVDPEAHMITVVEYIS